MKAMNINTSCWAMKAKDFMKAMVPCKTGRVMNVVRRASLVVPSYMIYRLWYMTRVLSVNYVTVMIFHPGHIIAATTGSYDMTDILNIAAATTGQCVLLYLCSLPTHITITYPQYRSRHHWSMQYCCKCSLSTKLDQKYPQYCSRHHWSMLLLHL